MAGWRETNILKPIDNVTEKGNGELSGRNESERRGGLESEKPRRPRLQPEGEGSMNTRILAGTGIHFGGVGATA